MPELLRKMGVDPAPLATALRGELARMPQAYGGAQPTLSPRLRAVADTAQAEAERLKDEFVSTEHLLLAIASEARPFGDRARAAAARRHARPRSSRR